MAIGTNTGTSICHFYDGKYNNKNTRGVRIIPSKKAKEKMEARTNKTNTMEQALQNMGENRTVWGSRHKNRVEYV